MRWLAQLSPAVLVLALVAPVDAQVYGAASWDEGAAAPTCSDLGASFNCTDSDSCPPTTVCRIVADGGLGVCAYPDVLMCIPTAGGTIGACPQDRPNHQIIGGVTICLPDGVTLCGLGAERRLCFIEPGGDPSTITLDWSFGDCDSDGIANEEDATPCDIRTLSVAGPDGSCTRARRCRSSSSCESAETCDTVDGLEPRQYCLPIGRNVVPCCGGFVGFSCADGGGCMIAGGVADDFGFCDPFDYCPELPFVDRVDCLSGEGGFGVPPDDGDCDGDGTRNAEDETPCGVVGPDAGVADAGSPFDDASVPGDDAGAPEDGGALDAAIGADGSVSTMDGSVSPPGPGLTPQFGGGGGCRCGVAHRPDAPAAPWLALLALSLLVYRRSGS